MLLDLRAKRWGRTASLRQIGTGWRGSPREGEEEEGLGDRKRYSPRVSYSGSPVEGTLFCEPAITMRWTCWSPGLPGPARLFGAAPKVRGRIGDHRTKARGQSGPQPLWRGDDRLFRPQWQEHGHWHSLRTARRQGRTHDGGRAVLRRWSPDPRRTGAEVQVPGDPDKGGRRAMHPTPPGEARAAFAARAGGKREEARGARTPEGVPARLDGHRLIDSRRLPNSGYPPKRAR